MFASQQGWIILYNQIVIFLSLEIDLPEERALVSPLQLEAARGIFKVEPDNGPVQLARSSIGTTLKDFILLFPDRVCVESSFKFLFQPAIYFAFEQMGRSVLSVRQKEPEPVPAAKIHDSFRFGLHTMVEHVGQGFDLGYDKMTGFEVYAEVRIGFSLEFSSPIRDCYGLLPIKDYILAAFEKPDEVKLQPRLVLDIPIAFLRVENTAFISGLVGNLSARLQHLEVVDIETFPFFKPQHFSV